MSRKCFFFLATIIVKNSDWWIKLSALHVIGWYNCPVTANCPITTLHNIQGKNKAVYAPIKCQEIVIVMTNDETRSINNENFMR